MSAFGPQARNIEKLDSLSALRPGDAALEALKGALPHISAHTAQKLIERLDRETTRGAFAVDEAMSSSNKEILERCISSIRTGESAFSVTQQLAKIGSSAVPALIPLLNDPDKNVRAAVISALFDLKDRRAVAALCLSIEDADPYNQVLAVRALGVIGDSAAIPSLCSAIRRDSDRLVTEESKIALARIGAAKFEEDTARSDDLSHSRGDSRSEENTQSTAQETSVEARAKAREEGDQAQSLEDTLSEVDRQRKLLEAGEEHEHYFGHGR